MTMLSFRVDDEDAGRADQWAKSLGIGRSELLREALRRHLDGLGASREAALWVDRPLDPRETALAQIADWGPAEDWSDWRDAAR